MRILFIVMATILAAGPASLYADPFYPGTLIQVQRGGVYGGRYAPVYGAPGYTGSVVTSVTRPVRPVRGLLGLLGRSVRRRYTTTTVYVASPVRTQRVALPPVQPTQQFFPPPVAGATAASSNHPVIGAGPAEPFLPLDVWPAVKAAKTPEKAFEPAGEMNPSVAPLEPFKLSSEFEDLPPVPAKKNPFENIVTTERREAPAKPPAANNTATNKRATNLIEQGDTLFAAQRFHEAGQRYKSAIAAAPHHGGAYFRRAVALIATNRYDLAEPIARRGANVDPDFVRSNFRINTMYDGAALAKNAHLDALARTALVNDGVAANWFLVGMFLHFDGQPDRAQSFLRKASQLEKQNASHLTPFLQQKAIVPDTSGSRSVLQPAG